MSRPSTMAVMAAFQVLRPNDANSLNMDDNDYDLVRRALQAADRADPPIRQEFQERIRIMRAVAIYRGAVTLQAAYIIASAAGVGESQGKHPMEVVLEAMGILTAAETHLGAAPYPEGGADGNYQLAL